MKDFNLIIGNNLKNIRKQKLLSLDKVAEMTGVSKGMLAQIERGISNPTVTVLWKIATGLNVSFSYFMESPGENPVIISSTATKPLLEEDGMKVYSIFPYDQERRFEVFAVSLSPACDHRSEAHAKGVEESIIVVQGNIVLLLENQVIELKAGNALRYRADVAHGYQNSSGEEATFHQIIYYKS